MEKSRFMETENEDDDKEEETSAAQVKIRAAPSEPSARERAEHEATHIPYRSWCVHCVRGRGRSTKHMKMKRDEEEPDVPRISMDYFF